MAAKSASRHDKLLLQWLNSRGWNNPGSAWFFLSPGEEGVSWGGGCHHKLLRKLVLKAWTLPEEIAGVRHSVSVGSWFAEVAPRPVLPVGVALYLISNCSSFSATEKEDSQEFEECGCSWPSVRANSSRDRPASWSLSLRCASCTGL